MDIVSSSTPLVVAHRGLHTGQRPYENSIAAFEAAANAGADVLELDVRRTADGVLVVHHDSRMEDGTSIARTRAADLPTLPDGQRVTLLSEVAALAASRGVGLLVELKERGHELEALQQVRQHLADDRFAMMSFQASSVQKIEAAAPQVRTGLLAPYAPVFSNGRISFNLHDAWLGARALLAPVSTAAQLGADFVAVARIKATDRIMDAARAHNMGVYVWTVDDPVELQRAMSDSRIEGVITDRTDVARAIRPKAPALVG
jgi:glycerophosphoryl diester phosphodiesterase